MASRGNEVNFGDFGLQALGPAWLNSRQIEAARRAIVRYLRRGGKLWIRVFPDHPVTKRRRRPAWAAVRARWSFGRPWCGPG